MQNSTLSCRAVTLSALNHLITGKALLYCKISEGFARSASPRPHSRHGAVQHYVQSYFSVSTRRETAKPATIDSRDLPNPPTTQPTTQALSAHDAAAQQYLCCHCTSQVQQPCRQSVHCCTQAQHTRCWQQASCVGAGQPPSGRHQRPHGRVHERRAVGLNQSLRRVMARSGAAVASVSLSPSSPAQETAAAAAAAATVSWGFPCLPPACQPNRSP